MAEEDALQLFFNNRSKGSRHVAGHKSRKIRAVRELKNFLDWFESWLQSEESSEVEQVTPAQKEKTFDQFLDEVLNEAEHILAEQNIELTYALPGQNLGISEPWKCVKVFRNSNIYYRIGRTQPRKGKYQGQKILVIDLVMDGHKKQVFLPLLELKAEIEKRLG
ncbi:MAG: hypothetical protein ACPLRU_07660, partial [Desulfofundulus sp.]